MSFINDLFGIIAGGYRANTLMDFIPLDDYGKIMNVKSNPMWLGLRNPLEQKLAYESVYALAAVVDKLAEMDTNGIVEILRLKGKGKEDYATGDYALQMNTLLAKPNPLQSWQEFRAQQLVYKRIFGFCPVLPFVPDSMPKYMAQSMINLPPWEFKAYGTKQLAYTSTIEEIVNHYKVTLLGKTIELKPDQVFILKDSYVHDETQDYLLPMSKLVGLDMPVSNLCASLEADNVLLKKRGPLGFISHDSAATKDSVAGYIPMKDREKEELQETLHQYGLSLSQYQYAISRQAVKWNPMSFDVKQLGTKETVIESIKAICHRYGFPYILFDESETTFANGSQAAKDLYQNLIIPNSARDLSVYDQFFEAKENNAITKADYSWLPVLQEDEKEKAEAAKAWNEALLIEYQNGLITKNQWLTARGYDTIPGGDVYYQENENITPEDTGITA